MDYGRETTTLVEIDQPFCVNTYGVAPCNAQLGVTGTRKCYQTRFTCQDPDHYTPTIGSPSAPNLLTLRFAFAQEDTLQYGPLIPSMISLDTTPAAINLAAMDRNVSALGSREVVTIKFQDHQHSDNLVDPYRLERNIVVGSPPIGETWDPYERGTFWGKWLARNPYHSAYRCRVYEGFLGDAIEDMRVRNYVIDRIEGPTDGEVTLVAKDLFSIIEEQKAVAPFASKGELSANLTGLPATFDVAPAGIGVLANDLGGYASITSVGGGFVAIGDEIIQVVRTNDTFTVVNRGALGTTAEDHDAEDLVQLVLSYDADLAVDIVYDLLLNYTSLELADLPKADWDIAAAELVSLCTGRIATPTPVADLIGELSEQVGFTIWPDVETGQIQFVALRATAPTVTVDDDAWIVADSLSVKRQSERRASQVWVYYGQKNPTVDLDDYSNFHSRIVTPDLDAEGDFEFGVPAIREIFSRWIPQFGRSLAEETGERVLAMFRDPPIEASFRLHASRDGELALARYFALEVFEVQDDTGAILPVTMATVQIERGENELEIGAQQVAFAAADAGTGERVIYIENDAWNLNLRTIHDSLYAAPVGGSPGEAVRFVIVDGITVGSTSTAVGAIRTGDWPAGVTLYLDNAGGIQGMGGAAGAGGENAAGGIGQIGGFALVAEYPISVDNTGGEIWAGGGGGGGGGSMDNGFGTWFGGGGGGGGAGTNGGAGGALGSGSPGSIFHGTAGSPGSALAGGMRGFGYDNGTGKRAGNGGFGGGPGAPANGGSAAAGGVINYAGGVGGSAGNYIVGNAFVTWVATGDRRGGVA